MHAQYSSSKGGLLWRRTSLSFLYCTNSRRSVHREDVTLLQRGHRDPWPEADELAIDADRVDDVTAPFAAEKHSETFTPPYLQYITMASVASSLSLICSGKKYASYFFFLNSRNQAPVSFSSSQRLAHAQARSDVAGAGWNAAGANPCQNNRR